MSELLDVSHMSYMIGYLCEAPVLRDGRVAVVQRAGHAAHRHPAGAVGGDARRLRSGRAAARPSTAALAARPEPATMHISVRYTDTTPNT